MANVTIISADVGARAARAEELARAGHRMVGVHADWEEAVAAGRAATDVVIVRLCARSSVHALRVVARAMPKARLLAIADDAAAEPFFAALAAGARGYYTAEVTAGELHGAVLQLVAGHMPIAPSLTPHLVRAWREPAEGAELWLTAREREVLELLVRGHSYGGIALALDIELTTVQTHIRNLYRKLGVASKAEAATLAARLRLVV